MESREGIRISARQGAARTAMSVIGLALLWVSLHVSPYYPFTLPPLFATSDAATISAHHVVYAFSLIAAFALFVLARKRIEGRAARVRVVYAAAGVLGTLGCTILTSGIVPAPFADAGIASSLVLVAFSTAALLTGWFSLACRNEVRDCVFLVVASYLLFGVLWTLFLVAGDAALDLFSSACPIVSAVLLCCAMGQSDAEAAPTVSGFSLKSLPWSIIALCIIFIYFGVVVVRTFTAMDMGSLQAGGLGLSPQLVTSVSGIVITVLMAVLLLRKEITFSYLISSFAVLVLLYMIALLLVNLGGGMEGLTLFGKRVLVAAEHGMKVFLTVVLAWATIRRRLSPLLVSGLFGIFVCALPQFVAFDLMLRSGILDALSRLSLVTPAAAIGAFLVAAAIILLLVWFSSRTAATARVEDESRQESVFRQAVDGCGLTDREFDVAFYTYRGYSAKKTAEALFVSESTVKSHLSHVYRKLGIHSKQELIAFVDEHRGV